MKPGLCSPTEEAAILDGVLGLHGAFLAGLLGERTSTPGSRTDEYA